MAVPILRQSHYLIATIQSALTDADLVQLRDALVAQVGKFRSKGVIVDVTALDVLDSFASRTMRDLAHMIRLRGAETVIVTGLSPEIAQTLVTIGVDLSKMNTVGDLQGGIELAERVLGYKVVLVEEGTPRSR